MPAIKMMTYAAAMKDYFGYRTGEGAAQFMGELKMLSNEDKVWFRENLAKVGYEITTVITA